MPYYWLVTERMKSVLETLDREAFAFLKCMVQFPDGSEAPPHWLCDVIRVLDSVDEERSEVSILTADNGKKIYNFMGDVNLFSGWMWLERRGFFVCITIRSA